MLKPQKMPRVHDHSRSLTRFDQIAAWLMALLLLAVAVTPGNALAQCPSVGTILYVDATASPGGNGATWTCAYSDANAAISAAFAAGTITEIRMAHGTYKPATVGNPGVSFHLVNNCVIKGGYAGIGAVDPDARDIVMFETIWSGDLAGNDPTTTDNSHTVVSGSQPGIKCVME